MSAYVVVFEVSSPQTKQKLEGLLKKYEGWCPVTEVCWAIVTAKQPKEIIDNLATVCQPNDRVFAVRSGTAAAWRNAFGKPNDDWLKKYL